MKIFYDLGTHLFEGLREFDKALKFDHTWKIYAFEANPYTYAKAKVKLTDDPWLSKLDIEFYNAAISDVNGETEIECYYDLNEQDYVDVGSTAQTLRHDYFKEIHKDDIYAQLGEDYCHVKKVPTVCFSEFIDKHTTYGDEVIVKMDIEGSEFKTLSRMLADNTHTLVKNLFIEWHERFWPEEQDNYLMWKQQIMSKLIDDHVNVQIWW